VGNNGLIIGFSGKMRSGKTTAADYLANEYTFVKRSFAEPLRDITAYSFGIAAKRLTDGDFKKAEAVNGFSWRDVLIRVGQFYRSLDPLFWVNRMDYSGSLVVIDDVRFKNEANKIRSLGGLVVRIGRPDSPLLDDPSETELDDYDFDHKIFNDSDFLTFYNRIDTLIGVLKDRGFRLPDRTSIVGQGVRVNSRRKQTEE
jgi:hypothetical protein